VLQLQAALAAATCIPNVDIAIPASQQCSRLIIPLAHLSSCLAAAPSIVDDCCSCAAAVSAAVDTAVSSALLAGFADGVEPSNAHLLSLLVDVRSALSRNAADATTAIAQAAVTTTITTRTTVHAPRAMEPPRKPAVKAKRHHEKQGTRQKSAMPKRGMVRRLAAAAVALRSLASFPASSTVKASPSFRNTDDVDDDDVHVEDSTSSAVEQIDKQLVAASQQTASVMENSITQAVLQQVLQHDEEAVRQADEHLNAAIDAIPASLPMEEKLARIEELEEDGQAILALLMEDRAKQEGVIKESMASMQASVARELDRERSRLEVGMLPMMSVETLHEAELQVIARMDDDERRVMHAQLRDQEAVVLSQLSRQLTRVIEPVVPSTAAMTCATPAATSPVAPTPLAVVPAEVLSSIVLGSVTAVVETPANPVDAIVAQGPIEVLQASANSVKDQIAAIKAQYDADLAALMRAKDIERERQEAVIQARLRERRARRLEELRRKQQREIETVIYSHALSDKALPAEDMELQSLVQQHDDEFTAMTQELRAEEAIALQETDAVDERMLDDVYNSREALLSSYQHRIEELVATVHDDVCIAAEAEVAMQPTAAHASSGAAAQRTMDAHQKLLKLQCDAAAIAERIREEHDQVRTND
jgi:hypothetical protein